MTSEYDIFRFLYSFYILTSTLERNMRNFCVWFISLSLTQTDPQGVDWILWPLSSLPCSKLLVSLLASSRFIIPLLLFRAMVLLYAVLESQRFVSATFVWRLVLLITYEVHFKAVIALLWKVTRCLRVKNHDLKPFLTQYLHALLLPWPTVFTLNSLTPLTIKVSAKVGLTS